MKKNVFSVIRDMETTIGSLLTELESVVFDQIDLYLKQNKVGGRKYRLTGVHIYSTGNCELRLVESANYIDYEIDEDFESDKNFDHFLKLIKEEHGMNTCDVPSYYYPK